MTLDRHSLTPAEGRTGRMLREMEQTRRTQRIALGVLVLLHLVEIGLLLLRR